MNNDEKRIWLINYLINENPVYKDIEIPKDSDAQFRLFRSLCNVRMPNPISEEFLKIQDEYLKEENKKKGIVDVSTLKPVKKNNKIFIWQGDITKLKVDAIVNAANSEMLGCFRQCHACIDNCIHTFAGVELRLKCNEIIKAQGHLEPTGSAKITYAYNLPSKYIIHTVGPIVGHGLTTKEINELRSCYRECLKVADNHEVKSIAFCCISTGVFRFPQKEAAKIAIEEVEKFLETSKNINKVIFDVFGNDDLDLYNSMLN